MLTSKFSQEAAAGTLHLNDDSSDDEDDMLFRENITGQDVQPTDLHITPDSRVRGSGSQQPRRPHVEHLANRLPFDEESLDGGSSLPWAEHPPNSCGTFTSETHKPASVHAGKRSTPPAMDEAEDRQAAKRQSIITPDDMSSDGIVRARSNKTRKQCRKKPYCHSCRKIIGLEEGHCKCKS